MSVVICHLWLVTKDKGQRTRDNSLFDALAAGGLEFHFVWTAVFFIYGDVAELADAKVSKTFEITSRVGSIPTIPILFSGQWSVVSRQLACIS